MENLRKLLGDDWLSAEVFTSQPSHLLGRWYARNPNNPVTKYADELVGFLLRNENRIKCDLQRLATKLKAEFADTLIELDYAVFLANRGFQIHMEPTAPQAGPDLLAAQGNEQYYVEVRRVGLDEAHAAADLATEDVFERLCKVRSRYAVTISMTGQYSAYSPELKRAIKLVKGILSEIGTRQIQNAVLYYKAPDSYILREGPEIHRKYDFTGAEEFKRQVLEEEWISGANFVAHFDDAGEERDRTPVAVSHGPHPQNLQPDQTHLRLRSILQKKVRQLPHDEKGLILIDITELAKLMVDDMTLSAALYGDLQLILTSVPGGEDFQQSATRKPNGFFMKTARVSAVVVSKMEFDDGRLVCTRKVFPTNNPQANILSAEELNSLGSVADGLDHLCAERL